MKSNIMKTLSYAAFAVALAIVAGKIIGNGYKNDPNACKEAIAPTDCKQSPIAKAEKPPLSPEQPTPVKPASAAMTVTKPN